ncbi:uncharacterized protein YjbI with pentapeptide repeats [Lachnospiraceae bacterium PM6-15]|uniref:pentapeptide repeat-containing protein n=1 Tax=Ohessyouella blattaphilus TaxID=2949333 RepID=UPI003E2D2DEE
MSDLRKITEEAIIEVLDSHKRWLDSNGREGKRADLSFTDLREVAFIFDGYDLQKVNMRCADLSGADLSGMNLRGAFLSYAELTETNLENTNLQESALYHANLNKANLSYSDLRGADMEEAHLQYANLKGSNLQGGEFHGADFKEADLQGANLKGAGLSGAFLEGANLYGAILLETNISGTCLEEYGTFSAMSGENQPELPKEKVVKINGVPMKLESVSAETVKFNKNGKDWDIDQYEVVTKGYASTREFNIHADFGNKELSGDVVAFGNWEDMDRDTILQVLELVEAEGELIRDVSGLTRFSVTAYHGSGTEIKKFDESFTGNGNDQYGSGFYFTTNEVIAEGYATARGTDETGKEVPKLGGEECPTVTSAKITLENPIYIDGYEHTNLSFIKLDVWQAYDILKELPSLYNSLSDEAEPNPLGDYYDDVWQANLETREDFDPFIRRLAEDYFSLKGSSLNSLLQMDILFKDHPTAFRKAVKDTLGYDGIVIDFESQQHVVAWFPEQVDINYQTRICEDLSERKPQNRQKSKGAR